MSGKKKSKDKTSDKSEKSTYHRQSTLAYLHYCCSNQDIVKAEEIMEKLDAGGKMPLPLCKYCLGKKITPPTTGASTYFFVQAKQAKATKKRALDTVVSRGLRKGRGTTKGKN